MLIAQVTDVHLGFDRDQAVDANQDRLEQVLGVLTAMAPQPDLLLVTGDLVEHAEDGDSYRRLAGLLAALPFPSFLAVGNHDDRRLFRSAFPAIPTSDGFIHYAIDQGPLRVLVLDTLAEGRHGGGLCEQRGRWLGERLAEQADRPTLLALHHPPIAAGLSWMGESPAAEWVQRLARLVAGPANLVGLVCGHFHRPIMTLFAGVPLIVCPSIAPQVALDLGPIDAEQPDGRPMIVAEAPGFALHLWSGGRLTSHFGTPPEQVLARFTPQLQPLLRLLREERDDETPD